MTLTDALLAGIPTTVARKAPRRQRTTALLFAILLGVPSALVIVAGEARADTITIMSATLPTPSDFSSTVWDGTNAYIFGGNSPSGFLDRIPPRLQPVVRPPFVPPA